MDLYKEIIIRNPKKVGSSGLTWGLGSRVDRFVSGCDR